MIFFSRASRSGSNKLIFVTSESDKNKTSDTDKVEIETSVIVGDLDMSKVNTSDTPLESREIQTSGLDENNLKKSASNINKVNISDTLSDTETDSGMSVRRTLVFIMILINLLWIKVSKINLFYWTQALLCRKQV